MRTRPGLRGPAVLLAPGLLLACTAPAVPWAGPSPPLSVGACRYDVDVAPEPELHLDVRVRCEGTIRGLVADSTVVTDHLEQLPSAGDAARYRLRLAALARRVDRAQVVVAYGRTVVAPVSTWLLRPLNLAADAGLTIRIRTREGARVATALEPVGPGQWYLSAADVDGAGVVVFGTFEDEVFDVRPRAGLSAPAEVRLVFPDLPLGLPRSAWLTWARERIDAVAGFWGGFPVPRALVVLNPLEGRGGVPFGRVVAAGGPTVLLWVGAEVRAEELRGDWVLLHELLHLGFPSPRGAPWLGEGLATYFEPLIQVRAGWRPERAFWAELTDGMPRGLPALTGAGLADADDVGGIYWGGSVLWFLADVAVRQRTGGERGIEHALREMVAAGLDVRTVHDSVQLATRVDVYLGEPTLRPLVASHVLRGSPLDLPGVFRALGVEGSADGVSLRGGAAAVGRRHSVVFGGPPYGDQIARR